MKSRTILTAVIMCLMAAGALTPMMSAYYESDFFPIGITNTGLAGSGAPYGPNWTWDGQDNSEKALIDTLGINCIGCEPTYPGYLADLRDTSQSNYLYKVVIPSHSTANKIYLILANYSTIQKYLDRDNCNTADDTTVYGDDLHMVPSAFFGQDNWENDYIHQKWAPVEFQPKNMKLSSNSFPNCLKTETENISYEGTSQWQEMVDTAIARYASFLGQDNRKQYIWGYNLFVENPALCRNADAVFPWRGAWGAVNRVLEPFRESTDAIYSEHPWIVAKGVFHPMHRAGYNIFDSLPKIDAFLIHTTNTAVAAIYNYGQQKIFDQALYYTHWDTLCPLGSDKYYDNKNGLHAEAIYFQKYGNTNLAYPEQERRWMGGLWLEWRVEKSLDPQSPTEVRARRPCPPEIRCLTYLNLSRGAKGMFFVCWSGPTIYYYKSSETDSTPVNDIEPNIAIPVNFSNYTRYFINSRGVGLRDYQGYPFGYWGSARDYNWYADNDSLHRLNNGSTGNGSSTTYWHTNNWDTTYSYLAHSLIPEIKKLGPTLIQLDWVNGYSLNSTDSEWAFPCPHEYVMDISGVSYMDLGLFDHPCEPIGVEYFMLVNREGIADMTNRTVTVALDAGHWPGADSLSLTDIANKEHPQTLKRNGDRFVFTQVFEPGEGKLYRVSQINQAPIALSK